MLGRLQALASVVTASGTAPLLDRAWEARLQAPPAVLQAASELARRVLADSREPSPRRDMGQAAAAELFAFLAALPREVEAPISSLDTLPPGPARAWDEPGGDAFSALESLVQCVWEHVFGPEAGEDPEILSACLAALPSQGTPCVHDLGCGAGHFAVELARRGARVLCSEPNPVKRAFLRFRAERQALGSRLLLVRPERLPDACADVALAINVLDHMGEPVAGVEHLARVLRPGGALVQLSRFPDDGWHQGGHAIREATARALVRHFALELSGCSPGVPLDRFIRRAPQAPAPGLPPHVRLHPAARFAPLDARTRAVHAPRFYVAPMYANGAVLELLEQCRPGSSVDALLRRAERWGLDREEVQQLLGFLLEHRVVWPEGRTTWEREADR